MKLTTSTTIITGLLAISMAYSCGGGETGTTSADTPATPPGVTVPETVKEGKGLGEIKSVSLTNPLDESMVKRGKAIADMKCASCHKETGPRVVGPSFEGVTSRRKPEWIMNMITNTDAMLEKDPAAQALLEECLTRMPNQNVSVGDARDILEFLRNNDFTRTGSMDQAVNN
jgi:cytochrome c